MKIVASKYLCNTTHFPKNVGPVKLCPQATPPVEDNCSSVAVFHGSLGLCLLLNAYISLWGFKDTGQKYFLQSPIRSIHSIGCVWGLPAYIKL